MIPLTRERTPAAVHRNFYGARKQQLEAELLYNQRRIARGELDKHPFNSDRWKQAKPQLMAETHGKCAYCEAPTSMVAYGDVEHYRPKSTYWWLAYNYENYLVSCQLCNQKFKKAEFPVRHRRMRGPSMRRNTTDAYIQSKAGHLAPDPLAPDQVTAFRELHRQERPLLLNPYVDNPVAYFAWRADDVLEEVELVPVTTNPEARSFCHAAMHYYGLNRQELKSLRYFVYKLYRQLKRTLQAPGLREATREEILDMITQMQEPKAPVAGMIRYFDHLSDVPV